MKNIIIHSSVVAMILLTSGIVLAQEYDLVINNGRVMDPETNFDGISNVDIKDGKIYKNTVKYKQ